MALTLGEIGAEELTAAVAADIESGAYVVASTSVIDEALAAASTAGQQMASSLVLGKKAQ